MKRLTAALAVSLIAFAALAAGAQAEDEFEEYVIESASATLSTVQAGGHPDFTTDFTLSEKEGFPYALTRDIAVKLPPGLFGNPQAFPTCSALQLGSTPGESKCPLDSQIGSTRITLGGASVATFLEPIYNMPAPGGDVVARFGFFAGPFPALINVRLDRSDDSLIATAEHVPSAAALIGAATTFWGIPAAKSHDFERITPAEGENSNGPPGGRQSNLPETPFMTNPTSCEAGQGVTFTATSYQLPEQPSSKTAPFPQITGCGLVSFRPQVTVTPTTSQATTGSGLDAILSLPDDGLKYPNLSYDSEAKRVEVKLPQGVTVNPSEAEGLGVCTEADFAREAYDSAPNVGCPESSKIGSTLAVTPVLDKEARGALFLAKPYQNPFGSLLALYMTVKVPDRGIIVTLAGKVSADPVTGQLTTVFDDVPQLPVSSFDLHFREGARAPLVTPPACGNYQSIANLSPWSTPLKATTKSSAFAIESGVDHGPCPTGGLPPFRPGLIAGAINNAAGSFSPFNVRLTRTDAEQEITHFSIKLPPGITAKFAGIPYCSDAAIAAARARTGPHGGEEELLAPSCPAGSEVGHSLAGAGVGGVLTYVPGKIYLAGPYNGSALSIAAITAAKAGPFDLGTVVLRYALKIDPETAEAFIDATGSDPIPHIIQGIPVHLRDIRAYVDRPGFTLNPTDCSRTSTASTLLGSGLDFGSEADDRPVTVSTPFQVADCAALPFKPRLSLKLKGGTRRGSYPALTARLRMHGIGEAGISGAEVILPKSEFIANAHFETICTKVQFKAGVGNGTGCPARSIYGRARGTTPLFSEALAGPVYLRSSEHQLPDLVVALHNSQVDVDLVAHIDSVKGRLRSTFEAAPDAPVTSFVLEMQGGKKGLFENSTNLCKGTHKAEANFTGQNGKVWNKTPELVPTACKTKAKKAKHQRRAH